MGGIFSSGGKESACNAEDRGETGSIPAWEDPLEKENGNPLQYSHLKYSTDSRAWQNTVKGSQRVRHN